MTIRGPTILIVKEIRLIYILSIVNIVVDHNYHRSLPLSYIHQPIVFISVLKPRIVLWLCLGCLGVAQNEEENAELRN